MVEKEEMKVGLLVWWERMDHGFIDWSCPCVVTEVTEGNYKLRSLDDFKDVGPLQMDDTEHFPSSRNEMRVCTLDEVRKYLEQQKRDWQKAVKKAKKGIEEAEREYRKTEKATAVYEANAQDLLNSLS